MTEANRRKLLAIFLVANLCGIALGAVRMQGTPHPVVETVLSVGYALGVLAAIVAFVKWTRLPKDQERAQ